MDRKTKNQLDIDITASSDSGKRNGLDLIRRQDAIDIASGYCHPANIAKELMKLPSAEPEIIYCKDCKKHNMHHGHYYSGKYIGVKECCPLIFVRGLAQGHEFDYQFCAEAERRADNEISRC